MPSIKSVTAKVTGGVLIGGAAIAMAFITIPSEGIKHKAFRDGGGIWTICRGHTLGVYEGMIADDNQCAVWVIEDMQRAEHAFDSMVTVEAPQNVKASALDFIFNTGPGNFRRSTLRKKINLSQFVSACAEYPKWKMMGKLNCSLPENLKKCGGLPVRRERERNLCLDQRNFDSFSIGVDNIVYGIRPALLAGK